VGVNSLDATGALWAAAVNYGELEAEIPQLVVGADEGSVRAFGEQPVTRLVRTERLRHAAEEELTEGAWTALTTTCENVLAISTAELGAALATIYDGILVDDGLDGGVLAVIVALAHWHSYLKQNRATQSFDPTQAVNTGSTRWLGNYLRAVTPSDIRSCSWSSAVWR
jgi:hypothetical protein